jgi:2-(1,2-epoxy-1,2-dihydrophenyl)acetyl-CoA isomerase
MAFETLLLDVRDGVAKITLNRPDAANALSLQMAKDLMAAATQCDEDPAVRAVLITATGRMFCAGGDLGGFASAGEEVPTLLKEMATHLHVAVSRFARMRAPVVAGINGTAAGAGFSLACACDLAVAAESARFTMAYTRIGLTPDGSATYYLPRLVGARRALELMLTNRALSAAEALDWGLINQVVPDDQLAERALALTTELAAGPTEAFGRLKRMILNSTHDSLESQMELETRTLADSGRTADAREGIQAFLAKRAAKFAGA